MSTVRLLFFTLVVLLTISSCSDNQVSTSEPVEELRTLADVILSDTLIVNPTGVAPLTAVIELETEIPVRVELFLEGKNGEASNVAHSFEEIDTQIRLPILGLYPDESNTVELLFYTSDNELIGTKEYSAETDALNKKMPDVTINVSKSFSQGDGWTLVSYYGYAENRLPHHPFIFDSFGDIRWYFDFREHPQLEQLYYDDGMERLQNGNLYFGYNDTDGVETEHSDKIYEINMLGEIINTWEMPGYKFHHEVHEKPNGNFVVTVDKIGEPTIEDYLIEIERNSGEIINEWNLNESLDNTRKAMTDDEEDWFHANAVYYDESDNSIVVSGRTQGVVKLSEQNDVIWIMGPHRGWDEAPDGTDLTQFLLQPLDAEGQPIEDDDVLDGSENHEDFEWNWYQHAPVKMSNGNILLFDNGDNRNFADAGPYSRAVEYRVDEQEMTIQQVWEYGKERGADTYSRIVSDVDYLEDENTVVFSPGAIASNGRYGKAVEIDYETRNVVFEATITPPSGSGYVTFHRTERLPLYPEK